MYANRRLREIRSFCVILITLLLIMLPQCSKKVRKSPEQIKQDLEQGLRIEGSVSAKEADDGFAWYFQCLRWDLDLKIANNTPYDLKTGKNMFLVESNLDGSTFEGVAIYRGENADQPADYGSLFGLSNYDCRFTNGENRQQKGSLTLWTTMSRSSILKDKTEKEDLEFGDLLHGSELDFRFSVDQGIWVRDEDRASMRIFFPQMEVETVRGPERFRLIGYFQTPASPDSSWKPMRFEVIHIGKDELKRLAETPETHPIQRIFAINWLAETEPAGTCETLVPIATHGREGQLLATSLEWLAEHHCAGAEEHALKLLTDEKSPNGIRRIAAKYLGAMKYEPAFTELVRASRNDDDVIAGGAIQGLGSFGSKESLETLLKRLRNTTDSSLEEEIAETLAGMKSTDATSALIKLASNGNEAAFSAIVKFGPPESYDYFSSRLQKKSSDSQRDDLIEGLKRSGQGKAMNLMIDLLETEEPPAEDEPFATSKLVELLLSFDSDSLIGKLAGPAGKGNLRALQVIAGSKNQSAADQLTEKLPGFQGTARLIALGGLAKNWAVSHTELLSGCMNDPDPRIISVGIEGLANTGQTGRIPNILPFLSHDNEDVCESAAKSIEYIGVKDQAQAVFNELVKTQDEDVARPLVGAFIDADWKDVSKKAELAGWLSKSEGDMRFQVIRLMRHVSGDAMGPEDYSEWENDPETWVKKWTEWAAAVTSVADEPGDKAPVQ